MMLVTTPLAPPGLDEFLGLSTTSSFALPIAALTIAVWYLIGAVAMWALG